MNHYPVDYSAQHLVQGHGSAFHATLKPNGYDDRGSQSPSDDGSYLQYPKSESELEEDPNISLIAQTLNVDGTPKRPMNAFMIFARRRRPQVSAENQAMRTGEISKILSREWNAMELIEKQFYLDQAKQLKETFNMKYPDYVYRRRPNNSRKKRRTDLGSNRALDQSIAGGDESCSTEFDDTSPVDEDLDVVPSDPHHAHMPVDTSYDMSHPRGSSYTYSSPDIPYRQSHGRVPYPPSGQQRGNSDSSTMSPRHPQTMDSTHHYQQSYVQTHQNHLHSPNLYSSEHDNMHGTWDPTSGVSRTDQVRPVPAGWSSQDRPLAGIPHDRSQTYPPASGQSSWGRTGSPEPARSASASSPSDTFSTLSAPFYQSQLPGNYANTASPSISNTTQPYHTPSGQVPGGSLTGRLSPSYDHRSYAASSPSSNTYPSTPSRGLQYQQHSHHPHIHIPSSATTSSGTPNFWPRDKSDGQ